MSRVRDDWLVREQFQVVRVARIPYAHNPSRCDYYEALFDRRAESGGAKGRRFFESLTPEQFSACHYHQLADWRRVAMTSVRLYRGCLDRPLSELYATIGQLWKEGSADLSSRDWEQVEWLFRDPIVWGGNASRVTNGQHRTYAIRASEARLCVIDHNRFSPYE